MGEAAGEWIDRLDRSLGARYSPHTKLAFRNQARRFLGQMGVKDAYTREDVLAFVDTLIRSGYKSGSINTMIAGVRALFYANGLAWPLEKRDTHLGLPQDDEGGPVMQEADVARLIALAPGASPLFRAEIALSSTYGLRASELAAVLSAGCDGTVLTIQTAKGGRTRQHTIPPALRGYLVLRPTHTTRQDVTRDFHSIMAHVRPTQPREGWHSIRRALVTGLQEHGVTEFAIHRFFGWRVARTAFKYYRPDPIRLDAEIYAKHPFLATWDGTP